MIHCTDERIQRRIGQARRLWLFLDYDGTLADFAPTPEVVVPDKKLISLIERLASHPDIRVTVVSGRRLAHIEALLPVPDVIKAGSYGLELLTPTGETTQRVDYDEIRPLLDDLKQEWEELLVGRVGFFLEDKGWTLAIHAKDAAEPEASTVLHRAQQQANWLIEQRLSDLFRLQGGHRFLECGPMEANKRGTVEYLLTTYPWRDDSLLVYLGDDDKDEAAFETIQEHGGLVAAIGERLRDSSADCWLPSPRAVRLWLQGVLETRR